LPFCAYCGTEIPEGAGYCTSCGRATGSLTRGSVQGAGAAGPVRIAAGPDSIQSLVVARDIVMKKKILSLREHYDLEDTGGKKIGEGDGNFIQMPAKFVLYDFSPGSGRTGEVMRIEGKLISLRHQFNFYDSAGISLGSMKKKIVKLIGQEYWIEKDGTDVMRAYGNFVQHDYRMESNGQPVAQVHKKWVTVRDEFGISITGNFDSRLVIGAVIVIEHLEVTARNQHSGS
jgi:uncharacterized protein YxjI